MTVGRRIYVVSGRIVGPFALIGLKVYTAITRRPRVRVIVLNEHGEILLVRGIISHLGNWTLPGGGVNRKEPLVAAAKRELYEETGIERPESAFTYLRTVSKHELHLGFDAPLFSVSVKKNELPKHQFNPIEIAAIGWFASDNLPSESASLVHLAMNEYVAKGHA